MSQEFLGLSDDYIEYLIQDKKSIIPGLESRVQAMKEWIARAEQELARRDITKVSFSHEKG